jgi:hypothetical protein
MSTQHMSVRRSPVALIGVAAVVIVLMAGALVLGARRPRAPRTAGTMSAEATAAELDQLRKAHGLGASPSSTGSGDDGTRRELDRLREKYGINTSSPHNPNDGSVPNGGAVTFDQWRREHPDQSNYQFR